ncbi:putative transcription factor B3-Domain family [Helianthus annuus]|nr:putative transcription factor B3-Domain family [Helianthus annuus]
MLSFTVHTLKGDMVYGFAALVWKNDKKSLKLPAGYGDWIKTFAYPEKNAVIRTLDGRVFEVKVMNIAGDYFLYNGWLDVVTSLKLPDNSLFVPHSMLNTCPSDPVVVRSARNRKWVVRMDMLDHELYITTGWSRIKKEMSITNDHLLVFEMVDFKTFDLSVFSCKPALLTFPPELSVTKKEPTDDLIEVSDDELPNPVVAPAIEQSDDDEVPVTFVVDNHFRLKKKWAQTHSLDRKMDLTIKDSAGQTWDVAIGVEFSQGCPRYNVTGMREFVRDKQLVYGSQFQMIYVKRQGMLLYN